MKKNIAVFETNNLLQQVEKILKAIARHYDHQFIIKHVSSIPELLEEDFDAAFCNHLSNAQKEELRLTGQVATIKAFPTHYYLSPLKMKNIEGMDILIYSIYDTPAEDNRSINKAVEKIVQSAITQCLSRKSLITYVGSDDNFIHFKTGYKNIIEQFPQAHLNSLPVSTAIQRMVSIANEADVLITNAEYGEILTTLAATFTATPGMMPQIYLTSNLPLFSGLPHEANMVNPVGVLLAAGQMLDYFGLTEEASLIKSAVNWSLLNNFVTKDIDSTNHYTTDDIGDLISDFINGSIPGFSKGENLKLHQSTII